MKMIISRITKDIKKWYFPILVVIIYGVVTKIVFKAFCPFLIFTGVPCAGCGITRAIFYLITGNIKKSLELNPAAPMWIFLAIIYFWKRYIKGESVKKLEIILFLAGLITFLVYICRMIIYFPGKPPIIYFENNILKKIVIKLGINRLL